MVRSPSVTRKRIAVLLLLALAFGASATAALQFKPAKHRKPHNLTNYGWNPKPLHGTCPTIPLTTCQRTWQTGSLSASTDSGS